MSKATNTKLMDSSPGGENTQYESQNTFIKEPSKSSRQFGDDFTTESERKDAEDKKARGEKTAENVRFGEAVSEHDFGGETVGNEGGVGKGSGDGNRKTRREQGYSGGNNVGA